MSEEGQRSGHGWGAYFWPMLSFLLLVEISRRVPPEAAPVFLVLKVAVPLAFLAFYFRQGRYPELHGYHATPGGVGLDVAVGIAGAMLWMAPFLLFPSLRPDDAAAFDPEQFGAGREWLAVGLRCLGFGLVTPFVEELFARSWLHRYVQVLDGKRDFRRLPVARASWAGFLAVVVYWLISHAGWEAPVAVLWAASTTLWLYYRGHLVSLVIVHAASNLSILACVVLASGRIEDRSGAILDLWYFL